ncbi:MAG: cytochrome c biogenesis protein CcsA, partial [Candidatus Subteraquimicrobiales bacterium]|nr:cytochrome c biogenesis protein CcsA [Candidatus Subteraquimicrobiales bacterium]
MAQLGQIALWVGLSVAIASAISLIYGLVSKEKNFIVAGHTGVVLVFISSFISSLALLVSFLREDLSLLYVASYSSKDLPLFYKFAAFWAGQQGSLLLWQLLLSLFTLVLLLAERRGKLLQWTFSILLFLQAFFLLLLAIPADPFKKSPMFLSDGFGLNPLLQHLQMVFHPPALFVGYAAFAIPFALALSALITKQPGIVWVERARSWTLFAWIFLGIGIFLGALWAYEVLGWGGYWGWDPVENAS